MSASPAAGAGGSSRAVGYPHPGRHPHPRGTPCAPPGAAAPGKGSGLPSAPGAGGSSGDAGARRSPPVPPGSPLSRAVSARQPSLSAAHPGKRRAALPSRFRGWRERAAPLRRPGLCGQGGRGAETGDGERRALPPRPLAHLQAPHAGGAGAGGRRRAAPGKGHFGPGSRRGFGRFLGRCRPRLWGSCRSPRGWLYKYVCRCLLWGSVAGFCARRSGESVWKARPSGAFLRDRYWGSGAPALRAAVP